jgi:hypothetical protein
LPVLASGRLEGPVIVSAVPMTLTVTVACVLLPARADTEIGRFVGSPAVFSEAVTMPFASVLPGCDTDNAPEFDWNVTATFCMTLLFWSRTRAVIVAAAVPSDGICGLDVSSCSEPTGIGVPGPEPTIELSPPPLHAASNRAAVANQNILSLCISLIL